MPVSRMSRLASALLGSALVLFASARTLAEPPPPLVVKIHADWCGTCTRLEPTLDALQREWGDRVRFVVLDVTDRGAVESSREKARALGIEAIFDAHKSRTGTVAVVGADGEAVEILKGETDPARYRAAIETARAS